MVKSYLDKMNSAAPDKEAALKEAEQALKDALITLKWEEDSWELQEKLFPVISRGARLKNPEYDYQEDDDYWAIQSALRSINMEKQRFEHEKKIEQIKKVVQARREAVEELKGELR